MAKLSERERAALPDTAFAYVDSRGHRRLPIHDEAHVRAAMSRFNQVRFESEKARERAFQKVLRAALGYGIVPVGFVAAQMRRARLHDTPDLPQGQVTLMLTDIEGSTGLVDRLGDDFAGLLDRVRDLIRAEVGAHGGYEVDARADEFFAVFPDASHALDSAMAIQRRIAGTSWPAPVRIRMGLHSGAPARTDIGYVGMPVHTAARVCSLARGGQILLSRATREELGANRVAPVRSIGSHELRGIREPVELFEVIA